MPQQTPGRSTARPLARPDASMSLLTDIVEHSLDDGYAEAARRRGAEGRSGLPRTLRAKLGLATALVLAALVLTVGAAQARVDAPSLAKEREELITRVEEDAAAADALQEKVDALRTDVQRRQSSVLRSTGGSDLAALLAGATAVEGPGVKLVVDDAEDSSSGSGTAPRRNSGFSDTGRVRDRDMQRIVNGLWSSGAEGVSINGQRLTALSAIRAAGEAILVDNKPLVPPYTVLAVGDGPQLASAFGDSADGVYLQVLKENYDVRYTLEAQPRVGLPAASSLTVRTARPTGPSETGRPENTGKGSTS